MFNPEKRSFFLNALPYLQVENAGYELERLYTDVTSLCGRIELLPCSCAKDRLAQSGEGSAWL